MRIDDGAAAKSDVFCPARLRPPERALPPLRLPAQLLSNSLGCVPRDAYRTDLTPLCRWPPIVVAAAPHLVREVLGSERAAYVKPALTKAMLGPLVGDGLLLAEGASWRWQRSMQAPLFRRKAVLAHVPAIASCGERMIAQWRAETHEAPRDITIDMAAVAFDVIATTLMRGRLPVVADVLSRERERYLSAAPWRLLYALAGIPDATPRPGQANMKRCERALRKAVDEAVRAERKNPESTGGLVSKLLAARDPANGAAMPASQVVDNVLSLLLAGHDATAAALSWVLYLLARQPQ